MTSHHVGLWDELASRFHDAAKEEKSLLAYHYTPFNRGRLAGMQMGRQKALLFGHSAKGTSAIIPEHLRHHHSFKQLVEEFTDYLLMSVVNDPDNVLPPHSEQDDITSFREGRVKGLHEFKETNAS